MATYRPMSPARNRELVEAITAIAHRAVDDMLARGGSRRLAAGLRPRHRPRFLDRVPGAAGGGGAASGGVFRRHRSHVEVRELGRGGGCREPRRADHAGLLGGASSDKRGIGGRDLLSYLRVRSRWRASGARRGGTPRPRPRRLRSTASIPPPPAPPTSSRRAWATRTQWALLEDDPGLIHDAWREALRLEPAFVGLHRGTHEEIEYEGVRIPDGINLMMGWGAANRDPGSSEDPDRFDIRRPKRRSLHFGAASRVCKGRHLAMRQG